MKDTRNPFQKLPNLNMREGPPVLKSISFARANDARTGNLTRTNGDTDWPIGCSESESRRGLTSGYPMRKGGPVASLGVVELSQRGGIHTYWSHRQSNPLLRFCLSLGRTTVHTACQQNPLQCSNGVIYYSQIAALRGDTSEFTAINKHQEMQIKNCPRHLFLEFSVFSVMTLETIRQLSERKDNGRTTDSILPYTGSKDIGD